MADSRQSSKVTCELNKLAFYQKKPWNLATTAASSQTRNGGTGRPNLIRRMVNEESDVSLEDSSWSESSSSGTDDEQWLNKAPATRVIVEVDGTKAFMEKNFVCQECKGPVSVTF